MDENIKEENMENLEQNTVSQTNSRKKPNKLNLISFILSIYDIIALGLLIIAYIFLALICLMPDPSSLSKIIDTFNTMKNLILIHSTIIPSICLLLGIIGLIKKQRNLGLGIASIVISIIILVTSITLKISSNIIENSYSNIDYNTIYYDDSDYTFYYSNSTGILSIENTSIKFNIPSEYESNQSMISGSKKIAYEKLYKHIGSKYIEVKCELNSTIKKEPKEYLEEQLSKYTKDKSYYSNINYSEINKINVNNNIFYYITIKYDRTYGTNTYQYTNEYTDIISVYQLPNNYLYTIYASTHDDIIIDINTIYDFMIIE